MQVVAHADSHETAVGAASRVAALMSDAKDRFTIGMAGGTTPASMYTELRRNPQSWDGVHAWLSDERWVSHDDERSNGGLAARTILDHVGAVFHRPIWSEATDPSNSAAAYEATLRSMFDGNRPDLILLGIGADGHTASLFPGSDAISETERLFMATTIPETGEDRLTATFPLIWSACNVLVMAVGDSKAQAVRDSFQGIGPAGKLAECEGEVEWYLDRSAASLLS